jgi:group I intron endonuclease
MIAIYKITSPTEKVYVGQSIVVEARWAAYRNGYSQRQAKLHASFIKHGVDQHRFEVLRELPDDTPQIVIDRHEQLFMDLYREAGYELLNLRSAGSTGRHSQESRQRMRGKLGVWMTGRTLSPATIEKRTAKQRGMKRSAETKQRLSESKIGENNPRHGKPAWNTGKRFMPLDADGLKRRNAAIKESWAKRKAATAAQETGEQRC